MTSSDQQLCLQVADIPVCLTCKDQAFFDKIKKHFRDQSKVAPVINTGQVNGKRPVTAIDVAIAKDNSGFRFQPSALLLDGFDEYTGTLDTKNKHGEVTLTSEHPVNALMNYLRQVYVRLILADNGIVLHAACIVKDSAAWIFSGRSGAGKSTICELSPDYLVLNDDLIAVKKTNGQFLAWGMPGTRSQKSEVRSQSGNGYKIAGIFRLVQDKVTRLIKQKKAKAAADLTALSHKPSNNKELNKQLELINNLLDKAPFFNLHFQKDPSFWKYIKEHC